MVLSTEKFKISCRQLLDVEDVTVFLSGQNQWKQEAKEGKRRMAGAFGLARRPKALTADARTERR